MLDPTRPRGPWQEGPTPVPCRASPALLRPAAASSADSTPEPHRDREIACALNDAGFPTSGNRGLNRWTKDSLRPMLQNRFYVGEHPDGEGGWLPGKHGALIDPALFERAQAARAANTNRPRWVDSNREPWTVSVLAV